MKSSARNQEEKLSGEISRVKQQLDVSKEDLQLRQNQYEKERTSQQDKFNQVREDIIIRLRNLATEIKILIMCVLSIDR